MLVNNAATNPVFGPLADIEEDAWDRIMALNVKGYLLAAQRAARAMAPLGRGAIVNVASTAGLRASPGLGAYSVSKAAVIMLTRVLGRELAPLGIRVNGIAPALIETRFSEALWKNPEILEGYLESTPLGRAGPAGGGRRRGRLPAAPTPPATSPGRRCCWTAGTSPERRQAPRPSGVCRSGQLAATRRIAPAGPRHVTSCCPAVIVSSPRRAGAPSIATSSSGVK